MKKARKNSRKMFGSILFILSILLCSICMSGKTVVTKAASSVVESAISWAVSIANDNSHGYSQINRWGPDYDCSSLVISAFRNAGVDVGAATYTGNMRSQLTQHGFQWISWSQIGGTSNLQRGDILLSEKNHTEIYLGNNQNVGAHSSQGHPEIGDQTGGEISVSGYYNFPWDGVLRYVGGDSCSCSTSYEGDYEVTTGSLPLNMRSGHGTGYSVVTSIPKGSTVYVSRADGNWAHVRWNGYSGYCSMQYLTKITSKSYRLHVWVSDTGMGSVPSNYVVGNRYYICYELIDESTGKKANETSNISFKATETIQNSKGNVYEYTYENSDNNWISFVCDSEDTYTGTVTISGDVEVSSTVSFEAFAETTPQARVWMWDANESEEIYTTEVGKNVNVNVLIRDKNSKKNLNDSSAVWTSGDGYTTTIKVYNPTGNMVKSQSFKNKDCAGLSFTPNEAGEYKITADFSGNINGSIQKTIEVKTPSATVTLAPTEKPTATATLAPTEKPAATATPEESKKAEWRDNVKSVLSKLESWADEAEAKVETEVEDKDVPVDESEIGNVSLKYAKNIGGRKMLVRWNRKAGVTGYQIQYSTDKNFRKSQSLQRKRTTCLISKLSKKKTYYVHVRAYKIVDGEKRYGEWSKKKKVKIKR